MRHAGRVITCYGLALVPVWGRAKGPIYSRDEMYAVVAWTLVDEEDLPLIVEHKWNINGNYVLSRTGGFLHRLVARMPMVRGGIGNPLCDHINRNTMDNRKANLRATSHAENMRNRSPKGTRRKYVPNVEFSTS